MDLWIRSQNREALIKCDDISIDAGNRIVGYFDKQTEYEILGEYETKERAIEVLDEIQRYLNGRPIVRYNPTIDAQRYKKYLKALGNNEFILADNQVDIIPASTMVYQMPPAEKE